MIIRCCDFDSFEKQIKEKNNKLIMFGAGAIGQISTPGILSDRGLLDHVDCYLDNDQKRWGTFIEVCGKKFEVKAPDYLNECSENAVILLNISRFFDVIKQLEGMDCSRNMECFAMPMMLIQNYCLSASGGQADLTKEPVIPRKLHYMWLGKKAIPDNLKKCIDSWKHYCPDYEIIEWNEDNYDVSKNRYMKEAYDAGAYGFVPDYARLDILYNEGGFYLDTDVEIKRSIDELRYQHVFCGVEKWQIINFGGLSGAEKGHPMIKEFLKDRENLRFINPDGSQNRNTCGFYDTRTALRLGYKINGQTQSIRGLNIYAFDYFHSYDYMSGIINSTENTYSIHHFNGGWLDDNMKKANEEARREYEKLVEMAR